MLNPTPAVAKAWTQSVNKHGTSVQEIPNSRLIFTSLAPRQGQTLQAANLLKERVRYCMPLAVPFVNTLIKTMMTGPLAPSSAWEQGCYARGGLPIAAVSAQLMQSALNPNYVTAGPAPGGGGGSGGGGTGGGGTSAGGGTPSGGGTGGGAGGGGGGSDGTPDACPISAAPPAPSPAAAPPAGPTTPVAPAAVGST